MLGTPFHDVTMDETLDAIARMIQRRAPSYIVTANLDFATQAASDVELQRILIEAELVLCDGTPLVWTSRLTGHPLRERVAGSDLVPRIAERGAREGWRIFLLGGDPKSLEGAAKNLAERYPGLTIAGTYSPPFAALHEFDHADIAARVQAAKPDVLLVAFGCPKQEKWIYAHYRSVGVPCSIGVGATIDFLAGKVQRAPGWLGKLGLEWVFRMAQEPGRLVGRYSKDLVFLFRQILRERNAILRTVESTETPKTQRGDRSDSDAEVMFWKGPVVAGTIDRLGAPSLTRPFIIDLSMVTMLDSSGMGHLLRTLRKGWAAGMVGCYSSPSEKVTSVLQLTRLDRVLPIARGMSEAYDLLEKERVGAVLRPVVDSSEGSLLLVLPQRVMNDNASECAAAVQKEWSERPALRTLRLDLGATQLMDSSGLGFILRCHRMVAEREGGRMELLNTSANVRNVFKVARLEKLLGLAD
jgi:exopolysaccharide biosynthesis WecB/TagA/CpsF family protein/anti-anti-sigma factor